MAESREGGRSEKDGGYGGSNRIDLATKSEMCEQDLWSAPAEKASAGAAAAGPLAQDPDTCLETDNGGEPGECRPRAPPAASSQRASSRDSGPSGPGGGPGTTPAPERLYWVVLVPRACYPLLKSSVPSVPPQVHVVQWRSTSEGGGWVGGLCDCCLPGGDELSGCFLCCLTCWCPCVTFGRTVEKVGWGSRGQSAIFYLLSSCGTALVLFVVSFFVASGMERILVGASSLLLVLVGMGLVGGYYRSEVRKKLGLRGNRWVDRLTHTFCSWCALCQEYRTVSPRLPKRPTARNGRCASAAGRGAAPAAVPIILPPSPQAMVA